MEIHSKKRRLEKTAVACPIVYGSCAMWLGKKAEETATHRWTLFIRGPNDENLSSFISHVAFSLHPSFLDPVRGNYDSRVVRIYSMIIVKFALVA